MANENTGKAWSPADQKELKQLAKGNTPTGLIVMKLGRTDNRRSVEGAEPRRFVEPAEPVPVQPPQEVSRPLGYRRLTGARLSLPFLGGGRGA